MAVSPFFFDEPHLGLAQITTASTALAVVSVSSGAYYGTKIVGLQAVTDSSLALLATAVVQRGGVNYPIGSKTIPASAGIANGVPAVSLLDPANSMGLPQDNDGNPWLALLNTDFLGAFVSTTTAIPAGRTVKLMAVGGLDSSA